MYFIAEAEYAARLKKPIIPLLMEANFKPEGWLGILQGTLLYTDMSSDDKMTTGIEKLIKELGNRGCSASDEADGRQNVSIRNRYLYWESKPAVQRIIGNKPETPILGVILGLKSTVQGEILLSAVIYLFLKYVKLMFMSYFFVLVRN